MPSQPRAIAATLTVLLHLLILFALVRVPARLVEPPQPAAEQETTVDRLHGAGEQLVKVDIRPGLSVRGRVCAGSSYVGVGVTATPDSDRIILVGDDTPASRAGLQPDDVVLNPEVWQEARTEGALLRMVILREGVTRVVTVLVGKICIG
jgi:hypothetical protein